MRKSIGFFTCSNGYGHYKRISEIAGYLSNDFNITAFLDVSGKPPLLLIITAEPLLAASKLVLPNGSFHLEQTTEMLTFFNLFNIKSFF